MELWCKSRRLEGEEIYRGLRWCSFKLWKRPLSRLKLPAEQECRPRSTQNLPALLDIDCKRDVISRHSGQRRSSIRLTVADFLVNFMAATQEHVSGRNHPKSHHMYVVVFRQMTFREILLIYCCANIYDQYVKEHSQNNFPSAPRLDYTEVSDQKASQLLVLVVHRQTSYSSLPIPDSIIFLDLCWRGAARRFTKAWLRIVWGWNVVVVLLSDMQPVCVTVQFGVHPLDFRHMNLHLRVALRAV